MTDTILLVEDEPNVASIVELYLTNEGFRVEHATDGAQALEAADRTRPALVVLDLMLPGMDGLEVCKRLRARGHVPIVMLTARDAEIDRVVGLELGADDYVTKPFSPRELVARIRAVLRRTRTEPAMHEAVELGDIVIDPGRRTAMVGDDAVDLTAREFDLLAFLARNRGIVFSRDRLLETEWGYERPVETRTVDSHIKTLRRKLGAAGAAIKTVRGVGYKADA